LYIFTRFSVVDLIAVADIVTLLRAISPDRILHEPWKRHGKPVVELAGVDLAGHGLDDLGAAARSVAGRPIAVMGDEPAKDTGAVQKIVHQGIDRDHAAASFASQPPGPRCAEKQLRQRHRQHFVGYPVDFS
jgi:hypothetical protein